jgi:hypothetical protein
MFIIYFHKLMCNWWFRYHENEKRLRNISEMKKQKLERERKIIVLRSVLKKRQEVPDFSWVTKTRSNSLPALQT